MFYRDEPYAEEECFECSEKENVLTDVSYWLRAVLDQLYGLEEFKADDLERYLEELAHVVKMKLPKFDLAVGTIRKSQTVPVVRENRTTESNTQAMLTSWIAANKSF